MARRKKPLSPKEERAAEKFLATLTVRLRKTDQLLIVVMVGLVGSGKSTVARELAKLTTATVVESNAIRVHLRSEGTGYDRVWQIMERSARKVLQEGGNVVMDADFGDEPKKRAGLRALAQEFKARIVYIRVICERDVLFGRFIKAGYSEKDLFGGASTPWQGTATERGRVVALREMWRRTPLHYRWLEKDGGTWRFKKLPFKVLAEIDTTVPQAWKARVADIAGGLLKM